MIPTWIVAFNQEAARLEELLLDSPLAAIKQAFLHMRRAVFPRLSPLLAQARKTPQYGGQAIFFDVVVSKWVPKGHLYVMPSPRSSVRTVYAAPNRNYGVISGITP